MRKFLAGFLLLTGCMLPPSAFVTTHPTRACPQYESLLVQYAPPGGWDVRRMSGYMFRESRCQPTVLSNTGDAGLLQINQINYPWLSRVYGFLVTKQTLQDPDFNIQAAAQLCSQARVYWHNCYHPWGGKP